MTCRLGSVVLAAAFMMEAQTRGSADTRGAVWNPDFLKLRETAAVVTPKPVPVTRKKQTAPEKSPVKQAHYAYLGVTLWRDRDSRPADPEESRAVRFGSSKTPERINSVATLKHKDELQIAVESAARGYLYVLTREVFKDGTRGEAVLIFPHEEAWGGENWVEPGLQFNLTGGQRFVIERENPDVTAEEFTFLVMPKKVPGMVAAGGGTPVPESKLKEWERWRTHVERLDASSTEHAVLTAAEAAALRRQRRLRGSDPLPQTLFRVQTKQGDPLLVSMQLKIE